MKKLLISLAIFFLGLFFFSSSAEASHSWGGYHWARTSNPFNLKIGDNVSAVWDPILVTTAADWSVSTVLNMNIVAGQAKSNCRPTSGRIEVCNKTYGNNGWLGIAQIWASGLHITQGTTKLNDTYFNTSSYNTTAWRNLVMCQEVGHTLGLDHQDEDFNNANLGTCMDYTRLPVANQHPNQHDYDELLDIYNHFDAFSTINLSVSQQKQEFVNANLDNPGEWGREVRKSGRSSVFERDFGGGNKVYTFVVWAE